MNPVGDVGLLWWVVTARRAEFGGDGQVRPHQRQVIAPGAQSEIGVQVAIGIRRVVARGEHHEKSAGGNVDVGEGPLVEIASVVGQVPAEQAERAGSGVFDLDYLNNYKRYFKKSFFL